jgi:hypothetical protein
MLIGLEKEFFLLKDGNPQPLTDLGLPCDECGWLVEARGEPHNSIIEAIFSLKAAIYRIELSVALINANQSADSLPYVLTDEPLMKVDRATKLKCARHFGKGIITYQNLYGHESHRNALTESTAGVHVSFTESHTVRHDNREYKYNRNFDWPQIFTKLDKAFAEEIKTTKRRPGFYELKSDGRVEYRSLPANVDLGKLIDVLM